MNWVCAKLSWQTFHEIQRIDSMQKVCRLSGAPGSNPAVNTSPSRCKGGLRCTEVEVQGALLHTPPRLLSHIRLSVHLEIRSTCKTFGYDHRCPETASETVVRGSPLQQALCLVMQHNMQTLCEGTASQASTSLALDEHWVSWCLRATGTCVCRLCATALCGHLTAGRMLLPDTSPSRRLAFRPFLTSQSC